MRRKRTTRTSTVRAATPALPSPKRQPAADVVATRHPAIGLAIVSGSDAWRGSATVTMNPAVLAQASAIGAANAKTSAAAADPAQHPAALPKRLHQRNGAVLQANGLREAGQWADPKPASPKVHPCANRRKMRLTPRASAPLHQRGGLQDRPRLALRVLIALRPAVLAHGTTAPGSTTETPDPAGPRGWFEHSRLQRQKPAGTERASINPTTAAQPQWRWQQTRCDR